MDEITVAVCPGDTIEIDTELVPKSTATYWFSRDTVAMSSDVDRLRPTSDVCQCLQQ